MPKIPPAVYKHFAFSGGHSALLPLIALVFYFETKVFSVILILSVSGQPAAANLCLPYLPRHTWHPSRPCPGTPATFDT
jgi:hypothetical protein